ncbi:MAG: hypothetical protein U0694_17130 [Anaerolineae bacterium]
MKIHLVLSDDWELRGDGSGNMRALQFNTMRQLCQIYEDHGLRGSFNAEVMQQLHHLRWGTPVPTLQELNQKMKPRSRETYARGHDVRCIHLGVNRLTEITSGTPKGIGPFCDIQALKSAVC